MAYELLPDKALSVRQPWAICLVNRWKPVENRSWKGGNPDLRFRGEFAIHASTGMTQDEYEECREVCAINGVTCPHPAELQRGGIIGIARVLDVVTKHESHWFFGPKALVIADAEPVPFIRVGGQLGFFEWKHLVAFADRGKPVEPAKWMLDYGKPKPEKKGGRPQPERQARLL